MGPWCTGVAGRAGDHTIRGASKGVRPQGLLEGSMAGKLELPLSSANPPHPPVQLSQGPGQAVSAPPAASTELLKD